MAKSRSELIDDLGKTFGTNIQTLLGKAYDAGYQSGHEQGRRDLTSKLETFVAGVSKSTKRHDGDPDAENKPSRAKVENRAAPGSVQPAIEEVMRKEHRGVTTGQLLTLLHQAGFTLIKSNTVRGTLNTMKTKGATEKRGGLWYLISAGNGAGHQVDEGQMDLTTTPH